MTALHSLANALTINVLPEPDGPKNKKYINYSNFVLAYLLPNGIAINSVIRALN